MLGSGGRGEVAEVLSALRLRAEGWLSINFLCIFLHPNFVSRVWIEVCTEEPSFWKQFTCPQLEAGLLSSWHCINISIHTAQMGTGFPSSATFSNWFIIGKSEKCPSMAVWQVWRAPPAHLYIWCRDGRQHYCLAKCMQRYHGLDLLQMGFWI